MFGRSDEAGWGEHLKVSVTKVDSSLESGCPGGTSGGSTPDASVSIPGTGGACLVDADCNNNATGEGVVCKGGKCADGCRKNADCPSGTCSSSNGSIGKCSIATSSLGSDCDSDTDCNAGKSGTGRVCSSDEDICIIGCRLDSDCSTGSTCDSAVSRCVKRKGIGESCSSDVECNGGIQGTQRICLDSTKVCADKCRSDSDCAKNETCNATNSSCTYSPPSTQDAGVTGDGGDAGVTADCVFNYPSVSIKGVATPKEVKDSYVSRGCTDSMPACMIDTNNLVDAKTNQQLSFDHTNLSPNFSLRELSEQSRASSPYVYIDPAMVAGLQSMRTQYGSAMHVNSGYRSPIHQRKVCLGVCGGGQTSCEACAQCSKHMSGQGVDLPHSSPKCTFGKLACKPGGFHLIYNEDPGGPHLHLDMGNKNPLCTYLGWDNGGCGN